MSEGNGVDLSTLDMGGKFLRPYQIKLIENVRAEITKGNRNVIICAPTGAGKTITASALLKLCASKGKYGMFLAPRRELIKQACGSLEDAGVRYSVVAAGFEYMAGGDVLVASKDTLAARTIRRQRMELPTLDLLVIDECHLSLAAEFNKLLTQLQEKNPNLVSVGLSATPGRADGKGMGDRYQAIVSAATYEELRNEGFLVPCRVFTHNAPDMRGVRTKDWDSEAAKRVDKPRLVGDVISHWQELASDRQTIVFGASISHSIHLRDEFLAHGIAAAALDQSTPADERDQMIQDLKTGKIQVLCNCDVLSFGFDEPSVSCVVLVSPSRTLVRYRQRAGRALRPFDGKEDCILIDHAGAGIMHGFPDDDVEWPLEKSRSIDQDYQAARKNGKVKEPMVCQNCHCMFSGRPDCPNCGARHARKGRTIAIEKGLLKEIKRGKKDQHVEMSPEQIQKYWHTCLAVMANRGRTAGSAAQMFKHRTGTLPWHTPGLTNVPSNSQWKLPVSEVFPQYVKSIRGNAFTATKG